MSANMTLEEVDRIIFLVFEALGSEYNVEEIFPQGNQNSSQPVGKFAQV
jgi:hypothetical protein